MCVCVCMCVHVKVILCVCVCGECVSVFLCSPTAGSLLQCPGGYAAGVRIIHSISTSNHLRHIRIIERNIGTDCLSTYPDTDTDSDTDTDTDKDTDTDT